MKRCEYFSPGTGRCLAVIGSSFLGALLLLQAGCASVQMPGPPTVESACLAQFKSLDRRLAAAGLHDAGAYRIPGFPFLRSTRFAASFASEVKTPAQRRDWLQLLRDEDQQAREHELRKLGVRDVGNHAAALEDCGQRLVAGLPADDARFDDLLSRAAVPDDYSLLARVVGLYPFAVPFLRQGIAGYHEAVKARFSEPLADGSKNRLHVYRVSAEPGDAERRSVARRLANARRDALGRPVLSASDLNLLFRVHAPAWSVEQESANDIPGRPAWHQGQPELRPAAPAVYTRMAYTRFGDEVLLQLVYSLWFPARPPASRLDPYAGKFDGVLWRVTLGADGHPLIYDSIHACGCYHYVFLARNWPKQPQHDWWQEPVVFPQAEVPAPPLQLRLEAGTHYLTRVLSAQAVKSPALQYEFVSDHALRSLPDGQGGYRSLYNPNGLVPGSERLERLWLWPSGVVSPGAMRQWGRHATAFVGRRHFDDPRLLESLLRPDH